jgi:signal transduction histidine kinase
MPSFPPGAARSIRPILTRVQPIAALAGFVAAVIAAIGVITAVALWQLRAEVTKSAERDLSNLNRTLVEMAARSLQAIDLVMTVTVGYLPRTPGDAADQETGAALRTRVAGLPQLKSIFITDAEGRVLTDSGLFPAIGLVVADRTYFRIQRDAPDTGLFVDRPLLDRVTGDWSIFLSRRISGSDGAFRGIIAATMDPSYLDEFGRALDQSLKATVALLHGDGLSAAILPEDQPAIRQRLDAASAERRSRDSLILHRPDRNSGAPRILAVGRLPDAPYYVVNSVDEAMVLAPWRSQALIVLFASLGGAVALALFATLLARQLQWRNLQITTSQENAKALAAEKSILETVATSQPLPAILDAICRAVEIQVDGGLCSILLLGADRRSLHHGAAPSLPASYTQAIDGVVIGPRVGSCGTAAHLALPVVVADIAADPLWQDYREVARAAGLAACSSTPIFSPRGDVSGTFAIYFRQPRTLSDADLAWVQRAVHLAEIAIERSRVEEMMLAAKEAAVRADQTKSVFLMNMSHEFRTPLNAIIGFSEGLEEGYFGDLPERQRAYVRDIRQAGMHLLHLISDLLDLSKVDAEKLELYEEPLDVTAIVDSCVRAVATTEAAAQIAITAETDPLPLLLHADETRLKQILMNLLSNAAKFTPAGGRVAVRTMTHAGGSLEIDVVDTGIGMTTDEIALALQPFRQINPTLARRHGGAGLGLPLTKRLIELHDGTLELRSRPGAGTSARVIFPPSRSRPLAGRPAAPPSVETRQIGAAE